MTNFNTILAAKTKQFGLLSISLIISACATHTPKPTTLADIEHIIVIYAENRSFDHLYGLFPGANGIANATNEQKLQIDHNGQPLPSLPPIWLIKRVLCKR
ncbi:alkaline phosphatase family protein [Methylocucumis oryzae]|uniref:alkaline phosphatase family protein n=1 Tax=Methylocucumis oryzae TaxID=1632867 RepID=UPI000A867599|nr:alkaline phosphatase family protein [Methylocucumis oryzae]